MKTSLNKVKISVEIERIFRKVDYQSLKTNVCELKCSHNKDTIMIRYKQNIQDLQDIII